MLHQSLSSRQEGEQGQVEPRPGLVPVAQTPFLRCYFHPAHPSTVHLAALYLVAPCLQKEEGEELAQVVVVEE